MKTVQISPAVCFANGQRVIATQLNVESKKDNLFDYVQFKYLLLDAHGQHAGEGGYALEGREAYVTWDATPEGAYAIVAAALELQILPALEGRSMFVEVV